ncbi:MAG: phytanoyl-CoA dioxygenase [Acidimicrobiales bacterium mtb01]|nr:phytanoyl-CoA dioxygenase family protein [Actinomycetota bacterium]TEX47314.1 MAG: phytanoyl-CoA dioxygenase [Acidimicrobiales bacterium mtb01]
MNEIPRFTPSTPASEVAAAITSVGAAIIERLVPESTVDRLLDEMGPYIAATPNGADDFSGRRTTRTGALLARSRASQEFIAHPLVLGAVDAVLGPNATNYQLHLTQIIAIGPDSPAQPLHRDQWCFDFFPFPPEMDVEVSTIWALDDFTEENGATRIIPNSLLDPRESVADEHRVVQAVMPKGSIVLYSGRTIHGGGANRSTRVRRALNVDYVLGWLRQEENQYLSCPPDVARHLPPGIQKLAGYSMGAYALGYVDDVRDPMALLSGASGVSSFGGDGSVAPNIARG